MSDQPRGEIDRIVGGATPLEERLAGAYVADPDQPEPDRVEELLERWTELAAKGDRELFARRLSWEAWDPEAVKCCLGPGRRATDRPPWVEVALMVSARARALANSQHDRPLDLTGKIPFEELFAAHLSVAWERLERTLRSSGVAPEMLAPAARQDLLTTLASRLSQLSADALGRAFDSYRGHSATAFSILIAEIDDSRGRELYKSFVAEQLSDGLLGFYRAYPVAARLTAIAVDLWVRNSCEMLVRLAADHDLLRRTILAPATASALGPDGREQSAERVQRVEAGLSDPHNGGRTVHVLTLVGGHKIVYKPKGLGLEVAFGEILAWCNQRGATPAFEPHRVVDRGSYGWAEHVAAAACADAAAARRFYRRAGMLLCLTYAMGASDFHFENLIACGENPKLIDLETLLPVSLDLWDRNEERGDGWYEAAAVLNKSVLTTGMLPRWMPDRAGEMFNSGALGGGLPSQRQNMAWCLVNTDHMGKTWRQVEFPRQHNVPTLEDKPLEAAAYAAQIGGGFEAMYSLLMDNRSELLSDSGPLRHLEGQQTRLIFRRTYAYSRLEEAARSPECLADGAVRSVEIDALSRVYLAAGQQPSVWPIFAEERRALERADVPLFLARTDSTHLELPDGDRIDSLLSATSLDTLRDRLRALSEDDREFQLGLVRAALSCSATTAPALIQAPADAVQEAGAAIGRDELNAVAAAIADRIAQEAFSGPDGSVGWLGPKPMGGDEECNQLAVLDSDLFAGTAGIAVFLAAVERQIGGGGYGELALRAIAPLRRRAALARSSPSEAAPSDLGLGGLTGLGSWIYALVRIGEFLGEPELFAEADRLAALITPARISSDTDLDVTGGCAGAVLALLALDRAAPELDPRDAAPLELAAACGRHLLARRSSWRGGPRAWVTAVDRPPLCGYAHGAAGICHALLRLHEKTGADGLWRAVEEGLRYERGHFSPEHGNWRDLRRQEGFVAAWCHGAPGIALGRLATLRLLDDADVRREIEAALATTGGLGLTPLDHLCCGAMGMADILLYAYERLGEETFLEQARSLAGRVLSRQRASGRFRFLTGDVDFFVPSLFRGASGIGYACLRLSAPGGLPCFLALE